MTRRSYYLPVSGRAAAGTGNTVYYQPVTEDAAGRAWEALREDEIACRSLGLSPTRIKLTAFTISAAFAGGGNLICRPSGLYQPESFTFTESAFVLAVVVLGGMGSQTSVILAAVIPVVSEMMRDLNAYSMLLLGALMVLMMVWRPQGLLPVSRPHLKVSTTDAEKPEVRNDRYLIAGLRPDHAFRRVAGGEQCVAGTERGEIVSLIGPNGAGKPRSSTV